MRLDRLVAVARARRIEAADWSKHRTDRPLVETDQAHQDILHRPPSARARARAASRSAASSAEDAVAAAGSARITTVLPTGRVSSRSLIRCLSRRRTALRPTAPPIARLTTNPTRGLAAARSLFGGASLRPCAALRPRPTARLEAYLPFCPTPPADASPEPDTRSGRSARAPGSNMCTTNLSRPRRRPRRVVASKSCRRLSRLPAGSTTNRDQALSRWRPLARRAEMIARPARVRMRSRKPWVLARRRLLGWKVRLLTQDSRDIAFRLAAGHHRTPTFDQEERGHAAAAADKLSRPTVRESTS